MYPLHVLFNWSAAGSVRRSLRFPGRPLEARVVCLHEPFELGPIAPADPRRRTPWFRAAQIQRYATASDVARFWRRVCADASPIVWASHRSAHEQCALMELAWRRGRPFRLVDVAAYPRLRAEGYFSTGYIRHEKMVELELVAHARTVEQAEVDAYADAWNALAHTPEPMRIVTDQGLLAIPLSYFDEAILTRTPTHWVRAMVMIGDLLGTPHLTGYEQFDLDLLVQRIDTLIVAGQLETDNFDAELPALRIRRPST